MSFNSDMKTELCKVPFVCAQCPAAEALGLMLYAGRFSPSEIKIQAENANVLKRIISTVKTACGVTLEQDGGSVFTRDENAISAVYRAFGYEPKGSLQLNHALCEDECCRASFLRGVLLSGGCITSPEKGYHLEIVSSHYTAARQTATLLSEMDITPRYIQRRGNHILYFKDSSLIEDVLAAAGATNSAMEIMLKKVERELNNSVNRKVNCDSANLDKTVAAAGKQLDAIRKLQKAGKLDGLSSSLRETAYLRLENPELSLNALCELHKKPVSKPGLSSRFKRLIELSEEK
ncbi:MAG: DNA-binding protein WhiA [Clostridia bacterium]|nr:DNA-binding protein WhiA [Clostridia bacterium]